MDFEDTERLYCSETVATPGLIAERLTVVDNADDGDSSVLSTFHHLAALAMEQLKPDRRTSPL